MSVIITITCPACDAAFPVDPEKVPEGGARTQCTVCGAQFRVDPPASDDFAESGDGEGWKEGGLDPLAGALTLPEVDGDEVADEVESADAAGGDDWVVETEEAPGIGTLAEDVGEVDRLDTVEEEVRVAGEALEAAEDEVGAGDLAGFMAADEVMLTEDDLGAPVADAGGDDAIVSAFDDDFTLDDISAEVTLESEAQAEVEAGFDAVTEEFGVQDDTDGAEVVAEAEEAAHEVVAEVEEIAGGSVAEIEEVMAPEVAPGPEPEAPPVEEPAPAAATGFQFGRRDPHEKARRLARVLVSDMITYNPDRHTTALERGTIKEDFDEEIGKSWAEYVEQVGHELASSTRYWNDALNEILARGEPLF